MPNVVAKFFNSTRLLRTWFVRSLKTFSKVSKRFSLSFRSVITTSCMYASTTPLTMGTQAVGETVSIEICIISPFPGKATFKLSFNQLTGSSCSAISSTEDNLVSRSAAFSTNGVRTSCCWVLLYRLKSPPGPMASSAVLNISGRSLASIRK